VLNFNNFSKACIFLLYISLIIGFYFDENLNLGAKPDWFYTDLPVIDSFSNKFFSTLMNYDDFGHRHSPVYLIFLSFFKKIGFSDENIRIFHLHISLILIYLFYRCINLKFININKGICLLISCCILLSPTFRSLSIWPSTRIIGLIFFFISIFYYLKFQKKEKKTYVWISILSLIFASYISPNFSLFIIFLFYNFFYKLKLSEIFKIICVCMILSFPAIFYIFILEINFLIAGTPGEIIGKSIGLSFNISNKILIISSIILFHLSPTLLDKELIRFFFSFLKKNFFIIIVLFVVTVLFFDYKINYTGGGFFFQFSLYFFDSLLLFYLIAFFSFGYICFLSHNSFNNFLLFLIVIMSNIQNTIYHKYYDPLILFIFFTLLENTNCKKLLTNKFKLLYFYVFYIAYIAMRFVKNNYI
jgi:hypothetical protein